MIEFRISNEIYSDAEAKSARKGCIKGSVTKAEGNLAGFIGEIVFAKYIKGTIVDSYDYDIVSQSGHKIEVKTKRTSVRPLNHYNCSVSCYYDQKCDYYAFVRVHNSYEKAWILGYYSHEGIVRDGKFVKKGTKSDKNGFVAKLDSYAIRIDQLETDYDKFI